MNHVRPYDKFTSEDIAMLTREQIARDAGWVEEKEPDECLPSGWWLIPAALVGLLIWGALIAWVVT